MVDAMGACDGMVDLRPARVADARGIAQVRVLTWQVAYRDILPAQFLDELSVDASERRFREALSAPTPDRRMGRRIGWSGGRLRQFWCRSRRAGRTGQR